MSTLYYESSISHHGVKGQKWGVRRYQNPDGTLNAAGKRHVAEWKENQMSRIYPKYNKDYHDADVKKKTEKFEDAMKNAPLKKVSKAEAKLTKAEASRYLDEGMRMLEAKKIKSMTLDDINREDMQVKASAAASVVATLGTFGLAAVAGFPVAVISIPNADATRTDSRISKKEYKALKDNAQRKADENHKKRMERFHYVDARG